MRWLWKKCIWNPLDFAKAREEKIVKLISVPFYKFSLVVGQKDNVKGTEQILIPRGQYWRGNIENLGYFVLLTGKWRNMNWFSITLLLHIMSAVSAKRYFFDNPECAKAHSENCFRIIGWARSTFHLSISESVYIKTRDPLLCRQKDFVFAVGLLK